jgi:predicted outer membrane repeat protein
LSLESLETRECPASFTVIDLSDNAVAPNYGPNAGNFQGSLRWCLNQANAVAPQPNLPHTITFANNLQGNINLFGTLFVTQPVTVTGQLDANGNAKVTINRVSYAAQFGLIEASASLGVVNLNLQGGSSIGNGGAIRTSSTLGLMGCVFSWNEADNDGGAVHTTGTSLFVRHCRFLSNSAREGGAIYASNNVIRAGVPAVTQTLDIGYSDFVGNNTTVAGGALAVWAQQKAGGVSRAQTAVNIQFSQFLSNSADKEGGGIHLAGQNIPVGAVAGVPPTYSIYLNIFNQCDISGNESGKGGGLFSDGSDIEVTASTVNANVATVQGGGLYLESGLAALTGVTIAGNTAPNPQDGEGIYSRLGNNLTFLGCLIDINNSVIHAP